MNLTGALTTAKGIMDTVELVKNIGETFNEEKEENRPKSKLEDSIKNIGTSLEENIKFEIDKLDLNESIWQKISKSEVMDVVKVAIEAVIKGVLKKKFDVNYSTFNDMKDGLNSFMNGDLKNALKETSDAALGKIEKLDGTVKTVIKTIKNSVIDKVVNTEEYELINKQTKILNKISKNCEKFNDAMEKNDEKTMKSKVNAIKKDMKEILPIRETISKAQGIIDRYELWQNKGKEPLTKEETELIEKLNNCA